MLPAKHRILLQLSTGLGHRSIPWKYIMFSSGLNLFEALFPHSSTTLPGDTYGNAGTRNIEEYQQLVPFTHSSYPNLELHSFPQDHINYYPSYESRNDFRDRLQIEDQCSQEFYDEEPSHAGYGNWSVNQDLLNSYCWEGYYSSFRDDTSENTYEYALQNMQDFCLSEDGYTSHCEDENQDWSSFVLSGFESRFENQYKEHYPNSDLQEPSNSVANLELCESIFGYWPCMSRNDQQMFCDSA